MCHFPLSFTVLSSLGLNTFHYQPQQQKLQAKTRFLLRQLYFNSESPTLSNKTTPHTEFNLVGIWSVHARENLRESERFWDWDGGKIWDDSHDSEIRRKQKEKNATRQTNKNKWINVNKFGYFVRIQLSFCINLKKLYSIIGNHINLYKYLSLLAATI